MKTFKFYNLSGGVDLTSSAINILQDQRLIRWANSKNFEITKSGSAAKMQGNTLYAEKPGTKILGLWDYINRDNHTLLTNTGEGKLYKHTGSFTQLYQGLNTEARCNYVNAFKGAFISNGVDDPLFYDGNTVNNCNATTIKNGQTVQIRGQAIAEFKGRLFIACGSDVFYSALGKYNDWSTANDAGYIPGSRTGNGTVRALRNFGQFLAIYTDSNVTLLSGNSPDNFSTETFSGNRGTTSPFGVIDAHNKQFFYSNNSGTGIFPLQYGTLQQIELGQEESLLINPTFENLDMSRLGEITAIKHPVKDQVWYYFPYLTNMDNPEIGSTDLSICWIQHFVSDNKGKVNIVWYRREATPITCACVYKDIILTGTSDGKILHEDYGSDFSGTPIEAYFDPPYFNFGEPQLLKSADKISIVCGNLRNAKFKLILRKNYDDTIASNPKQINIVDTEALTWDVGNWDETIFPSKKIRRSKKKISGKFISLQPRFLLTEIDEDVEILGFDITDVMIEE